MSTAAALTSLTLSCASPAVAHYVHYIAHSALGCSKVHSKEKRGWEVGDSFQLLRSRGCIFLFPALPLFCFSLRLLSVMISNLACLSPTTTFPQHGARAGALSLSICSMSHCVVGAFAAPVDLPCTRQQLWMLFSQFNLCFLHKRLACIRLI